jgi:hypothetical protein
MNTSPMKTAASSEKRKYLRTPFKMEVTYALVNGRAVVDAPFKEVILKAANLSRGGICFETNIELKVGDTVGFLLELDECEEPMSMYSRVKWVEAVGKYILVGCEFLCSSDGQKKLIEDYINKKRILETFEELSDSFY